MKIIRKRFENMPEVTRTRRYLLKSPPSTGSNGGVDQTTRRHTKWMRTHSNLPIPRKGTSVEERPRLKSISKSIGDWSNPYPSCHNKII